MSLSIKMMYTVASFCSFAMLRQTQLAVDSCSSLEVEDECDGSFSVKVVSLAAEKLQPEKTGRAEREWKQLVASSESVVRRKMRDK